MASKNKKRPEKGKVAGEGAVLADVERLIAKEHFKDAVKQAKIGYQADPTPVNHRLLEKAYFLRANQLLQKAMPTSAIEVAEHLIEFGLTDDTLIEKAVGLLIALGMLRKASLLQEKFSSPEKLRELNNQVADIAVIHPERAGLASEGVREGAKSIREAINAVRQRDEARGMEALREISRTSTFADWKFFVRGLAAHSRGDEKDAFANWDRLDQGRAAARIVRALKSLSGRMKPSSADRSVEPRASNLESVERAVYGVAVLRPLEQLRARLAEDDWNGAIELLVSIRQALAHIDPTLPVRLTNILYSPLIRHATDLHYHEARSLVKKFSYAVERLPVDPNWNRLWALIWQGPQGSLDDAIEYWQRYLKDLEALPCLKPEERLLARAIVLAHLGAEWALEADELGETSGRNRPAVPAFTGSTAHDKPLGPDVHKARDNAINCFMESLTLCPDLIATYHNLIDVNEDWNRPDAAASTARRLLDRFPQDHDAVAHLRDYHFKREETELALGYALQARAIKPLDEETIHMEWAVRVQRARGLALKGSWDEARAEFATAEKLWPEACLSTHYLARKAVFELKASQTERAAELINSAMERLVEPAPLWLSMTIESSRYELPKLEQDRYGLKWQTAISKNPKSATAGALASIMTSFVGTGTEYKAITRHVAEVVNYIRRSTRLKYDLESLSNVCALLSILPEEEKLYRTMVNRGIKLFPKSPRFLLISGMIELRKGPYGGGDQMIAKTHLEQALKCAEASSDPKDLELLPQIREALSMYKDIVSSPLGMPFPGGPGDGSFLDFIDALNGMMNFEDDEAFDDDEGDFFPRPARAAPKKAATPPKSPKGKSKKG